MASNPRRQLSTQSRDWSSFFGIPSQICVGANTQVELELFYCLQHPTEGHQSKLITTHLATHHKNTVDLYGFFYELLHHNPQVRGSNP